MSRTIFAIIAAAVLAACAPTLTQHRVTLDDPSNPSAPESVAKAPSQTLDVTTPAEPNLEASVEGSHYPHTGTAGEPAVAPVQDERTLDSAKPSGHKHTHPEMDANSVTKKEKAPVAKPFYVCPMHHEVMSDHPGKCPKCEMTRVPDEPKPWSRP